MTTDMGRLWISASGWAIGWLASGTTRSKSLWLCGSVVKLSGLPTTGGRGCEAAKHRHRATEPQRSDRGRKGRASKNKTHYPMQSVDPGLPTQDFSAMEAVMLQLYRPVAASAGATRSKSLWLCGSVVKLSGLPTTGGRGCEAAKHSHRATEPRSHGDATGGGRGNYALDKHAYMAGNLIIFIYRWPKRHDVAAICLHIL